MRVWQTVDDFLDTLIEMVAIKSGLLLEKGRLVSILESNYEETASSVFVLGGPSKWWKNNPQQMVGLRAEEIEYNFIYALYSVGAIDSAKSGDDLVLEYVKNNAKRFNIDGNNKNQVYEKSLEIICRIACDQNIQGLDDLMPEYNKRNLLDRNFPYVKEWDGVIPLEDLFESESIPKNATSEQYFDQRYIDFLYRQGEQIFNMHWRQFEYFTSEFFRRHGYSVKIGPPRGDGGRDIILERKRDSTGPVLILVQCKRYARNNPVDIDKIKAFWTTINEEGATKGLIVTTSRIARGGEKFVRAHSYRLAAAEGQSIQEWIRAMASIS